MEKLGVTVSLTFWISPPSNRQVRGEKNMRLCAFYRQLHNKQVKVKFNLVFYVKHRQYRT